MSTPRSIVRGLLRAYGLKPQHELGQNFLVSPERLHAIAELAELTPTDTVLEVGPGFGLLTAELLPRAKRVIAIEIDRGLATALRGQLGGDPKLTVVEGDILKIEPPDEPYVIVANLQYYLSARFLRRFLDGSVRRPERFVVMLQREVAQKIVSQKASLLQLSVAAYATASVVLELGPEDFEPAPTIRSSVVRLVVSPTPRIQAPEKGFFALAHAVFQAPRKMLSNTLKALNLSAEDLTAVFEEAGVSPSARPETLDLAAFDRLACAVAARR